MIKTQVSSPPRILPIASPPLPVLLPLHIKTTLKPPLPQHIQCGDSIDHQLINPPDHRDLLQSQIWSLFMMHHRIVDRMERVRWLMAWRAFCMHRVDHSPSLLTPAVGCLTGIMMSHQALLLTTTPGYLTVCQARRRNSGRSGMKR
jgi:hypothetical protein